ncbi:MAG: hypothetical protein K8R23_07560 [Chthoniobacter sp.]|nr:hypothetical protein [Chthoniobacter sp.]
MNDVANLPPEVAPRGRWVGRGLLLLALATTAWLGWREYDRRAAIREAEAAGCAWIVCDPIALIRKDWHAAFQKKTWTESFWCLNVGAGRDLASLRPLLLRLRPTALLAPACKDANLDALKGLSGLQVLYLDGSTALQNVDALKGLSRLQSLTLSGCPALQNVDGLQGLAGLQELALSGCPALQNVDGLKGLTGLNTLDLTGCPALRNVDAFKDLIGLQKLTLRGCPALQNVDALKGLAGLKTLWLIDCSKLPVSAAAELRAALPKTEIEIACYIDP